MCKFQLINSLLQQQTVSLGANFSDYLMNLTTVSRILEFTHTYFTVNLNEKSISNVASLILSRLIRAHESRKKMSTTNVKVKRNLAAFDFDQTVVIDNTDTVIRDLLPKEKTQYDPKIGWTEYMSNIFKLLHAEKVSAQKMKDTVRVMPEVPGFVRLIKRLKNEHKLDLIIISDSNSVFIGEWLQAHGLTDCITEVFTNPAHFDETGLLHIKPYHSPPQTDCNLSAPNLCKGRILERFIVEQDLKHSVEYSHIMYVGDGTNDVCPVLRLRPVDFACVRAGYSLEKSLIKNRSKMNISAELIVWENGFDLYDQIEAVLCQYRKPNREDT